MNPLKTLLTLFGFGTKPNDQPKVIKDISMSEFNIDRATGEEFENAPKTIEMFCRTGFENIKDPKDNEDGKFDYIHVKLEKRFVTYKVVGAHENEDGEVSLSCRKVKAKNDGVRKAKKDRLDAIEAQKAALEEEESQLREDLELDD